MQVLIIGSCGILKAYYYGKTYAKGLETHAKYPIFKA